MRGEGEASRRIRPRGRRAPWPLAALTLLAALAGAPGAAAAPVPEALFQRAASEGRVGVLVELAVPFAPEGTLPAGGPAGQRQALATAADAVASALGGTGAEVRHRYPSLPWMALSVGKAGLEALRGSPWVASVQEDEAHTLSLDTSVPLVGADVLPPAGVDGSGRVVAVVDTGVNGDHPNLVGKVLGEACFSGDQPGMSGDCPNGKKSQVGPGAGVACDFHAQCFHGTHVAGIAAADFGPPNFPGVAPGADLVSIRIATLVESSLACSPEAAPCLRVLESDEIAALAEVYDNFRHVHPVAAVNLSVAGAVYTSQALCDAENGAVKAAVDNLRSVGIPLVAAAGNEGDPDGISEPACLSTAVSVSATTDTDGFPPYSNRGPFLDLWAPGHFVYAPDYASTGYRRANGTSMAAPHVAGAWALLAQAAPGAGVDEIFAALQDTGLFLSLITPEATRIRVDEAYDALTADCADGLDNDGDGLVDLAGGDPGCDDVGDDSERSAALPCDDGLDNDGDGLVDFVPDGDGDGVADPPGDPVCRDSAWPMEDAACQNGLNDDGKLGTDWDGGESILGVGQGDPDGPDPQCVGQPWRQNEESKGCGLGFEIALVLAPLLAARRRREAASRCSPRRGWRLRG